ncbi:MAG: toll/interleukin-1 receptor domain-containing protein [Chlorobium sp.]
MSYEYDVFFSYKRDPQSDDWHLNVKDKLSYWLRMELNQPAVRIFFDTEEIRTGTRWRNKLSEALKRSKCLICVWSPAYFQSRWCVSEWLTFQLRESRYSCELVAPASYHDGIHFPKEAQEIQKSDFSDYTSTLPGFWRTEMAVEFENQRLKAFARDVASLIRNAPPYCEDFPIAEAGDDQIIEENNIGRIATT